ncbi:invasion associated locus B family protein [Martelella mangrovi]|uniref:Invasion protein IalB n=1 Tax=Martelella mangrovi TaxID=1397477 RepID=A0ABV2IAP8_9HYPH|nr:invasion associated locus B family protein [uncultured Martelella sp.]
MKHRRFTAVIAAVLFGAAPVGQTFAALPDGASSLNETYQDWRVTCVSDGTNDRCAMVHNQVAKDSGQRVLTVELNAPAADQAQGVLVMPFGLALAEGVSLTIDTDSDGPTFGFSTCLPQGCLVPIQFDAAMLDRLKNGGVLHVRAKPVDGSDRVDIQASLNGFTAAFNRLNALR